METLQCLALRKAPPRLIDVARDAWVKKNGLRMRKIVGDQMSQRVAL